MEEAASPAARVEELEERVRKAEAEARVLKLQRAEDAKANEKVVGIFAAHRQSWIAERNRLKLQIQSLFSELRAAEAGKDEEERQRREAEEKLIVSNEVVHQLQERAKMEAEDHSTELWKHKTAFVEMVSSLRQLEADLGRALRQADVAKGEKEEAVAMAEKFRKDAEQKEMILSALLRKVKIDGAEKQMLLKEVKIAKARKKQAEVDLERWRAMWESNLRGKKGLRLLKGGEGGGSEDWRPESEVKSSERRPRTLLVNYLEPEGREHESPLAKGEKVITTFHCLDQFSSSETNDLDDIQHLQDWVRLETEKYVTIVEQRHCTEIDAFIEQLRLKDEKIDSFHWQVLGMEHESNSLQSRIEGLDGSLSQLRDENLKLENMLLYKENELKSLKEQLNFYAQHQPKSNSKAASSIISSESKIMKKFPREKLETNIQEMDGQDTNEDATIMQFDSPPTTASTGFSSPTDHLKDCSIVYVNESSSEEPIMSDTSTEGEEKSPASVTRILNEDTEISKKPVCVERSFSMTNSSRKTDIQALGVSYKIKRLKQQLLVLEKVSGIKAMTQAIKVDTPNNAKERKIDMNCKQIKGLPAVIAFLNKHVKRYQSLEEKTDDLCKRMNESYRSRTSRDTNNNGKKEQTEMLEKFLTETFQLQRYMVATGQKLLEIQSRITSNFAGSEGLDESIGFNLRQFAGIVGNLLTEIQRGLEVRISRIIGDLEGTLACDGILHI